MRQDIKELADAMQRGWDKYPRNANGSTKIKVDNKIGLCPIAHALIGAGAPIDGVEDQVYILLDAGAPVLGVEDKVFDGEKFFPVLRTQKVLNVFKELNDLDAMIMHLADEHLWTTPQVIAWLRSHAND